MNEKKFSFQKGWFQLRQTEIAPARTKIMAALNITTRPAFIGRLNGDTEGTPAERETIERIFLEYGIKDIWGRMYKTPEGRKKLLGGFSQRKLVV